MSKREETRGDAGGGPVGEAWLKDLIREVPDHPKPGIPFKDITTLLKDAQALRAVADGLAARLAGRGIDQVIGIEARGFIFAPLVACRLNAGFVPVRKPGKLPAETASRSYDLEYGADTLEVHLDAIGPGDRVAVVDDVLATGGTARATVGLVEDLGAEVAALAFVVELDYLHGRDRLAGHHVVDPLVRYRGASRSRVDRAEGPRLA